MLYCTYVCSVTQGSTPDSQILLYLQNGQLLISLGSTHTGQIGASLDNGDWHHVTVLVDTPQQLVTIYLNASAYCSMFPCQPCQLTQCNITLQHSITPTYGPLLFGSLTGLIPALQNQGLFLSAMLPSFSTSFNGCIQSLFVGDNQVLLEASLEPFTSSDPPLAAPGCPRETHCSLDPCVNGGCRNYWHGYGCVCPLDYVGQNCSECE